VKSEEKTIRMKDEGGGRKAEGGRRRAEDEYYVLRTDYWELIAKS